jgi:hypothetical protein
MPPYAKVSIRIDPEQMFIIESIIANNPFLDGANDIDENNITFPPLTNDIHQRQINDTRNEREHIITINSSPMRNRRRLQHQSIVTSTTSTSLDTIRNVQRIQDTNECIFRRKRDQNSSRIMMRLCIYALIYFTAVLLEYFSIGGVGPKTRRIKDSRSKPYRLQTTFCC